MGAADCNVLHADWPSNSEFVVSVGSTYLTPNAQPVCYHGVDCSAGAMGEVVSALAHTCAHAYEHAHRTVMVRGIERVCCRAVRCAADLPDNGHGLGHSLDDGQRHVRLHPTT